MNNSGRKILHVQGLAKSFPFENDRIHVLDEIELSLHSGQSMSIRGDSGCGKTTLLNLLARLETGDSGHISWEEYDMDASSPCTSAEASLRARFLGVVYQAYYLIPELDVLENVLIPARLAGGITSETRDRARSLLSKMGVGDKEKQIPTKLSGGERQRVAIARALVNQPKLILADEPTGNLDERTGGEVMDLLLQSCEEEKAALILVTHNPTFAKATKESLFLRQGKFKNG